MDDDVAKVLNFMEGKDVNIYQVGLITSYRQYPMFQWWVQELVNGQEYLVLSSKDTETRFSILMDEIYNIKTEKDNTEIIITLNSAGNIQIWLDLAS